MTAPGDAALPPYPYTPEEHRNSFVAKARSAEEQLFALSQDLWWELSQIWSNEDPATHAQAAANMKRVFEERIAKISWDDGLMESALAADKAWGLAPNEHEGEKPGTPHT